MPRKVRALQPFVAHGSGVNCLHVGPKSSGVLVTGGADRLVNVWRVGKPTAIMTLAGHNTPITSVRFNNTEESVNAGSQGGTIKVFALSSGGKTVRNLSGHRSDVLCLDTHPYHPYLLSGSADTNIKVWDIRRKNCMGTYRGHSGSITSVLFSPDGSLAASGGEDGVVKIWDLTAGKLLHQFAEHKRAITSIAFHPTEFLLATASMDKTIKFFDIDHFGLVSTTTTGTSPAKCIQFHPDGTFLIAAVQDQMKLFQYEPVKCLEQVEVPWNNVANFSIQQSTNRIVACTIQESFVSPFVVKLYDPNKQNGKDRDEGNSNSNDIRNQINKEMQNMNINNKNNDNNNKRLSPRRSPKHTSPIISRPGSKLSSPGDRGKNKVYEGKRNSSSSSFLDQASSNKKRFSSKPPRVPPLEKDVKIMVVTPPNSNEKKYKKKSPPPSPENFNIKKKENRRKFMSPSPITTAGTLESKMGEVRHDDSNNLQKFSSKEQDKIDNLKDIGGKKNEDDDDEKEEDEYNDDSDHEDGVDLQRTKPKGLDFNAFVPKKAKSKGPINHKKILKQMMDGREVFMNVLTERLREARVLQNMWQEGDVEGVIDNVIDIHDTNPSVAIDFFRFVRLDTEGITLRLCTRILPVLENLLAEHCKYDIEHKAVVLNSVNVLFKGFSGLIKRNRYAASVHVGPMDVNGEERNRRSDLCYRGFCRILGKHVFD